MFLKFHEDQKFEKVNLTKKIVNLRYLFYQIKLCSLDEDTERKYTEKVKDIQYK